MSKLSEYITSFDLTRKITQDDIEKTQALLNVYSSVMQQSAHRIDEMDREAFASDRQSLIDFINLAVDFDHDADRKRVAERLCDTGHNMVLLGIMEDALVMMKSYRKVGNMYFRILQARYFDAYCDTIEQVCYRSGVAKTTYYRHIRKAVELYAATLWCIVIPDYIIAEQLPLQA